ncbi:amidohydrolase family protein [Nocardia sp. 852002-20019_SCH5090214]|uniref:amidohydrolase family protein n=1 Tax=Nocardia sp. 852002-20019_SCH5090214 TaxID=1834087 RepID=UPI0035182C94
MRYTATVRFVSSTAAGRCGFSTPSPTSAVTACGWSRSRGFCARGDDYVRHVDPVDLPDLYRCRSLLDASVPLALSSDAPYGPIDPWAIVEAAVNRTTATGTVVNSDERVAAAAALRGYLGSPACPGGAPRRVRVGAPADLVVLRVPLDRALCAPSADHVRATVVHGQLW